MKQIDPLALFRLSVLGTPWSAASGSGVASCNN